MSVTRKLATFDIKHDKLTILNWKHLLSYKVPNAQFSLMYSVQEIERSEGKHFLILFRDAGCQFRALYSYNPETEEVFKMYGIGPRVITDKMFDRFYK